MLHTFFTCDAGLLQSRPVLSVFVKQHILIIEDEEAIASAVASRLESEGFTVDIAYDGPTGVEQCEALRPDLVILDVMLPGFDGIEVCRRIQASRRTPVLMLTARDDETDLLVGLRMGADDYVTKPFSPRELVARVQAVLRRTGSVDDSDEAEPTALIAGPVTLEIDTRRVRYRDRDVHLTPTEFNLLTTLIRNRGTVLSRDRLLSEVWGYQESAGARTVDSHVRAIRRKLEDELIRTVHSIGYALGDDYVEVAP